MRLAAAAFALVLLIVTVPAAAHAQQATGTTTIDGKVVNGSSGGSSVAGLQVKLTLSLESTWQTAQTDETGRFSFPGLTLSHGETYDVSVDYQNVNYRKTFKIEDLSAGTSLYVYDATTDPSALHVQLDHHIIDVKPEEKLLSVVNYIEVTNGSDRTIVAPKGAGEAALFTVPVGATHIETVQGPEDAPVDSMSHSLPPGDHKLMLAYDIPYKGDSLTFSKRIAYPTDRAVLIIANNDGKAKSAQLSDAQLVQSANGGNWLLSGQKLAPGNTLRVDLSDFPGVTQTSRQLMILAPIVMVLLAAGAGFFYLMWRRRRAQARAEA